MPCSWHNPAKWQAFAADLRAASHNEADIGLCSTIVCPENKTGGNCLPPDREYLVAGELQQQWLPPT